jgi:uncharacterized membrane protein
VVALAILAASDLTPAPILALLGFGVLVAIFGHLAGSRTVVATGIAILFIATLGLFLGGMGAYDDDPDDPRPKRYPFQVVQPR